MRILSQLAVIAMVVVATATLVLATADEGQVQQQQQQQPPQQQLLVQHSLDGGATWIDRGKLDPITLDFEATSPTWEPAQLQQLKALAAKKGQASVAETSVLVRVRDAVKNDDVHASIAVSPCALVVPRQYTTTLAYIAERYGITLQRVSAAGASSFFRVNSMRLLNPFHDEVCEPSVFYKSSSAASASAAADVKLKISFMRAPALKGISLPFGGGASDEANLHDGAKMRMRQSDGASAARDDKAPEKEQSFWDKWGMYIIIFLVVQMASGLLGGGAGAKKGEGAAAAGGGEK